MSSTRTTGKAVCDDFEDANNDALSALTNRPVPLQHFIYPAGAEGLFLVVDEKGRFREDNFQKAMSHMQLSGAELLAETGNGGKKQKGKKGGPKAGNTATDLFRIVKLIIDRDLDPCIVFSFSKRDCETYALQMARYV